MLALRAIVGLAALGVVAATILSAVNTFVVPRARPVILTRLVFLITRVGFQVGSRRRSSTARHRLMSLYPPLTLLILPALWLSIVLLSFTAVFWAVEDTGWRAAFDVSGSSLLTLGFAKPDTLLGTALSFFEAGLGITLLALLITYLPTIYNAFSRRETNVALMEVRAGRPPTAVEMLRRFTVIGILDDTEELWVEWERWFVELEESHTSLGSLALFRSDHPDVSWVVAAGAVLDAAALLTTAVDVRPQPRAALCLRSGFLALRRISDFYSIPYPADPRSGDPVSVDKAEFDAACAELREAGVPLKDDLDQAWRDFAGWRVNYDAALLGLAGLTASPPAPWSSDRATPYQRPPLFRRAGPPDSHGDR